MSTPTLVFIGGGNMAHALISGLLSDGTPADSIIVAEPDAERREQLAANLGIRTRNDNQGAAREADVLILAVKPQVLPHVLEEIKNLVTHEQLIISIVAQTGPVNITVTKSPSAS